MRYRTLLLLIWCFISVMSDFEGGMAQNAIIDRYDAKIREIASDLVSGLRRVKSELRGLAVINIREETTDQRQQLGIILENDICNAIIGNNSKTFPVVELRLDDVLNELKNQNSILTDPLKRQHFGMMIGAEALLTGTYRYEQSSVKLHLRAMDIATGEALWAFSADFPLAIIPEVYVPASQKENIQASWEIENIRRKSNYKAAMISAIIPGGGQYYLQRHAIGTAFFASELLLLGSHFYFDRRFTKTGKTDYKNLSNDTWTSFWILHGINILEALLRPAKLPSQNAARILKDFNFGMNNQNFVLSWEYTF